VSKFFVGQRVRVVRNVGFPHPLFDQLIGREGVVCDLSRQGSGGHHIGLRGFGDLIFHPDELEPILPDGHRAGDFTNVQDLIESLTKETA
jgi:hypothetical protein